MRGGYDGVVYANTREGRGDSYIAFRAEQIKSAIGNRGTIKRCHALRQGARRQCRRTLGACGIAHRAGIHQRQHRDNR